MAVPAESSKRVYVQCQMKGACAKPAEICKDVGDGARLGRWEELLEPNFEKQVCVVLIREDGILRTSKILEAA